MSFRPKITPAYLEMQRKLFATHEYGIASLAFGEIVRDLMDKIGARSLCDYGAGKQNLRVALETAGKTDVDYRPYDPAFPEYGEPTPADLVCCIDVLEHVEPQFVNAVLQDLRDLTLKAGLFTIATKPATKSLADGRNAHILIKPSSWWLPKLCVHFEVTNLFSSEDGFGVVVEPKNA